MKVLQAQHEQEWLDRVNADAEFRLASRWSDFRLTLSDGTGSRPYRIRGSVAGRAGEQADGPEVVLTGSARAWADFLAPMPPRHSHHVLAMDRRRDDFDVTAGRADLIRNLPVIDLVPQLMRGEGP